MNVTDYDKMIDDYNDGLAIINICTINENNVVIIIPTFLLTIPCGLSFLCFRSLMVYAMIEPLIKLR